MGLEEHDWFATVVRARVPLKAVPTGHVLDQEILRLIDSAMMDPDEVFAFVTPEANNLPSVSSSLLACAWLDACYSTTYLIPFVRDGDWQVPASLFAADVVATRGHVEAARDFYDLSGDSAVGFLMEWSGGPPADPTRLTIRPGPSSSGLAGADARPSCLVGFSGTGKSTVAELLRTGLGWSTIDVDGRLESDLGVRLSEAFAQSGALAIRARYSSLLQEVLTESRTPTLFVLGSSALMDSAARTLVSCNADSYWFDCRLSTSISRLRANPGHNAHFLARAPIMAQSAIKKARDATCYMQSTRLAVDEMTVHTQTLALREAIGFDVV